MTFPSINIKPVFFHKWIVVLFLFFTGLISPAFSQQADFSEDKNIPEKPVPPRLVNDLGGMLSERDVETLERKLVAYNDSTSTQIAVVTINSLEGYAEDDYAIRLARKWGIGQKDKNNGLLILISKEDRAVDIEVGYGLESYISDGDCRRIIDDIMIPQFRQNNYFEGVNDATDKIIGLLQGTYKFDEATDYGSGSGNPDGIPTWAIILIIIIVVFFILPNIGRGGGGWTGGSGGWTSGGGSWSGGGGFGGFGGGSFGGGGASGRW